MEENDDVFDVDDLLSSDAFFSLGPDAISPPLECGPEDELLGRLSRLLYGSVPVRELIEWQDEAIELFLPLLLQQAPLACEEVAARLRGRMLCLASYLVMSGMCSADEWEPFLCVARVEPTVDFFRERLTKDTPSGWVVAGEEQLAQVRDPFKLSLVEVAEEKRFVSGHAPSLIRLRKNTGATERVVVKADDLRTDLGVVCAFAIFNAIWRQGGVVSEAMTFDVFPMAPMLGMMQFVDNSESLTSFDCDHLLSVSEEELERFISSASGSFVACFVLGIRDRHRDNLMVRKGDYLQLWQLDFKHVFNNTTTGVDAPIFAIPRALKAVLKQRDAWYPFKCSCARALVCLRRRSGLVMQLLRRLFVGLVDDNVLQRSVSSSLYLAKTEDKAVDALLSEIELSVYSLKKFIKNSLHNFNVAHIALLPLREMEENDWGVTFLFCGRNHHVLRCADVAELRRQ